MKKKNVQLPCFKSKNTNNHSSENVLITTNPRKILNDEILNYENLYHISACYDLC